MMPLLVLADIALEVSSLGRAAMDCQREDCMWEIPNSGNLEPLTRCEGFRDGLPPLCFSIRFNISPARRS